LKAAFVNTADFSGLMIGTAHCSRAGLVRPVSRESLYLLQIPQRFAEQDGIHPWIAAKFEDFIQLGDQCLFPPGVLCDRPLPKI
jgi:hypothetical protein